MRYTNSTHQAKPKMLPVKIVMLAATCLAIQPAQAKISLDAGLGYDDNPLRLNPSLNPGSDSFWRTEIASKLAWDSGIFINAKLDKTSFSDDDRADSFSTSLQIGYSTKFGDNKHRMKLSLSRRSLDKTYVSRRTGQLFTRSGQPAGDRYDYVRWTPRFEYSYRLNKQHRVEVDLQYREQAYEDYTSLGLSNLDFRQLSMQLGWRYRPNKQWQFSPYLEILEREHDDRRAKDSSGKNIAGSNLQYSYRAIGLNARYKLGKNARLKLKTSFGKREDNASGYYDTFGQSHSLEWEREFGGGSELSLRAKYTDLDYERSMLTGNGTIEDDAETPSTKGWHYRVSYSMPVFEINGSKAYWYTEVNLYDISAELATYQFDRSRVESGLRIRF